MCICIQKCIAYTPYNNMTEDSARGLILHNIVGDILIF